MKNEKIINFYKDQISFFTKRMKRAEKNIKDLKSMGLEVDEFHQEIFNCEKENVDRYQAKLNEATK